MKGSKVFIDREEGTREIICEKKIAGGKYIKLSLIVRQDKIDSMEIYGDFFVYPEGFIEKMEACMKGLNAHVDEIENSMKQLMDDHDEQIDFIGISFTEIIELILEAVSSIAEIQ